MDHDEVVFFREGDDFFEKIEVHANRGGVVRKTQNEDFRPRPYRADDVGHVLEEIIPLGERHVNHVAVRQHHGVGMDGVCRARHHDQIARVRDGQSQMREPLLHADGDDGLLFGVDIHIVAAAIPIGDGRSQPGDAARSAVAMIPGVRRRFHEFFHDVRRGGEVGVPHTEIDDVVTPAAGLDLELVNAGKDVGRQAGNALELMHVQKSSTDRQGYQAWGGAGTFRPEPSLVIKARPSGSPCNFPSFNPREACRASSAL